MNLFDLQIRLAQWEQDNFPEDKDNAWVNLLGVAEEVGELCHAHLKGYQGIRGTREEMEAKGKDAVGDIVIYLMNYCSKKRWRIEECIKMASNEVFKRTWKPKT